MKFKLTLFTKIFFLPFLNGIIGIMAIPLIQKVVGIEAVGYYALVLSVSAILSFLDFGIGKYLSFNFLSNNNSADKNELIQFVETNLIFLISFIFLPLLLILDNTYYLIFLLSFFKLFEQFYRHVLIGKSFIKQIEFQVFSFNTVRWVGLIFLNRFFTINLHIFLIWLIFIQFLSILSFRFKFLNEININFNYFKIFKNFISYKDDLFKFWINQILKIVYTQFDKFLLVFLLGVTQFGIYNSIMLIPIMINYVSEVINNNSRLHYFKFKNETKNNSSIFSIFFQWGLPFMTFIFLMLLFLYLFPSIYSEILFPNFEVLDYFLKLKFFILVYSFLSFLSSYFSNYFFLINKVKFLNNLSVFSFFGILITYFCINSNLLISTVIYVQILFSISTILILLYKLKIYNHHVVKKNN